MSKSSKAHSVAKYSAYSNEHLVVLKGKLKEHGGKYRRGAIRAINTVLANRAKVREILLKD